MMTALDSYQAAIIDHLEHERNPLRVVELVRELAILCQFSPAWPSGPPERWEDALRSLVARGDVTQDGGKLEVRRKQPTDSSGAKEGFLF